MNTQQLQELLELVKDWRTYKNPVYSGDSRDYVDGEYSALQRCSDELESIVERYKNEKSQ